MGATSHPHDRPDADLRIAVDATAAFRGGGVSYLAQQLPALQRPGVSLLVFAQDGVVSTLEEAVPEAQFFVVPMRPLRRLFFLHAQLDAEARRWGADVIYCPGSTAPLRAKTPTVVCIQNPHIFADDAPRDTRLSLLRLLAWLSALRAADVVTISHAMTTEWQRNSGLRLRPCEIWSGPGVVTHDLPPEHPTRDPYILSVSNLYAYKRMDVLIAAYASDERLWRRLRLVIAGYEAEPGLIDYLRSIPDNAAVRERIDFLGFVESEHLHGLYKGASVYVSASEREAFPLTPAEALSAGKPVVLSGIPVHRELYGRWAHFPPDAGPSALAQTLLHALDSPTPPSQQSELFAAFSWTTNGDALHRVLAGAAAAGPPPFAAMLAKIHIAGLGRALRAVVGHERLRAAAVTVHHSSAQSSPAANDFDKLTQAKVWIAAVLCSAPIGTLIGALSNHRVPLYGRGIDLRGAGIPPATEAMIFWGIYERAECRFVRRFLRSDIDVIELGSSLGVTSAAIARRLDPDRRLICVEPNSDLLPVIRRSVCRYRPADTFEVVHAAVTSQAERDRGESVAFSLGAYTYAAKLVAEPTDATRQVPTTTIADLRARFGVKRFALVSDIEGAEAAFLLGDSDQLDDCDQVLIELHDTNWDGRTVRWTELREALEAKGFASVAQRGPVVACNRTT